MKRSLAAPPPAHRFLAVLCLLVLGAGGPAAAAPTSQAVLIVPADDAARAVVDGFIEQVGKAGVVVKSAGGRSATVACLAGPEGAAQRACLVDAASAASMRGVLLVRATELKGVVSATFEVLETVSGASVHKDAHKAPSATFQKSAAPTVKKLIAAMGPLKRFEAKPAPAATAATDAPRATDVAHPTPTGAAARKVALAGVRAGAGVSASVASALEEGLASELQQRQGLVVVTPGELRALLGLERQRQLAGAEKLDLAQVASFDANEVVLASVAVADASLVIDVRRVDGHTGAALGSKQLQVPKDDEAQVLSAPAPLIAALFPELPRRAAAPVAVDVRPLRVAVLEVRSVGDVPPRALAALNQSLTPELRKLQGVSAINSAEIQDMLSMERQKSLLGCSDEASTCFAEMAGALDADEMLTFDLTLVGSTYALASRRVDVRKSKVLQTRLERFDRRDGEELLAVVGPVLEALYPDRPLKPGRARGVEASVARRLNPPPLPRWAFFTTAGLGVAAAVAGGTTGYLMLDSQRQYNATATRATLETVRAAELNTLAVKAEGWGKTATGLFIGAGGLAVAAVVEAFFTDWHDDRAAFAVQPVAYVGGGGGLAVTAGF